MPKDASNLIPNVLELFSPEPHPDFIPYLEDLRKCKTGEEIVACVEKHGFTRADQNKVSATDPQNK